MSNLMEKQDNITCPECKGNGFVRVPYHLAREEQVAQCTLCSSQGEIDEDKVDSMYIDADGFHRLH